MNDNTNTTHKTDPSQQAEKTAEEIKIQTDITTSKVRKTVAIALVCAASALGVLCAAKGIHDSNGTENSEEAGTGWEEKEETTTSYSSGLTDSGLIDGLTVSDYLPSFDVTKINLPKVSTEYSDDDLETKLKDIIHSYRTLNTEYASTVKDGDSIQIDFTGMSDGKEIEGGSATNYTMTVGSGEFIDGFETQLIGHHPTETVKINVTFPNDYSDSDLAGKDATFTVKINGIYQDPEFTDEFVEQNFADLDLHTTDDLKKAVKQNMIRIQEGSALDDWIDSSVALSSYPDDYLQHIENLLDRQYKDRFDLLTETYQSYGMETGYDSYKDYYAENDDYMTTLQNNAETQVKRFIVYQTIYEDNNLLVTEDDYNYFVAQNNLTQDDISYYGKPYIMQQVIRSKVIDFVSEKANIVDDSDTKTEPVEETTETTNTEETSAAEDTSSTEEDTVPDGITVSIEKE